MKAKSSGSESGTGNPRGRGTYISSACDVCARKKIKCDGIKPVCQPCRQQGRDQECAWTRNTVRKPRTEQHFEALNKRAENLSAFVREYRKYADYLESLLEQCQQDYHPHYKVDFRASRPSDPDGLLGPSPEVLDHDLDSTVMGADDHDGSSDSGSDPTKEIFSPTQSLKLEEGGLIHHYGNIAPFRFDHPDLTSQFPVRQDNDSFPPQLVDKMVPDHRQLGLDPFYEIYLNSQPQDAPKPKQGKPEIITCWIAAEKALRHIQNNRPRIDSAFLKRGIQKSQYAVLAGFDESLIQDGIGYLEQVHIFTSADVVANSTLLVDLGKILSPFPSILFTESSHPHLLPVFKPDGTEWEFDEFLLETASKLADHGSTVAMSPTITSLSQTSGDATSGGTSSGSQESSGPGNEQKAGDDTKNKGDSNAGEEGEQQGDKKGKGREENPDDPGEPDDQPEGQSPGSVRFEVPSKLCLTYNSSHFQLLTVVGDLTIQLERHAETTKCRVLFTKLNFGSIRTTPGTVYEQFFVHVALDSQDPRDDVSIIKPLQTRTNDKSRKVIVGEKSAWSILGSIATTISPTKLQAALTGTAGQTGETSTSAEQVENTSQVNPQTHLSRASCAFNINDPSHKKNGTQMTDDMLPTIDFEFFQDAAPSPRVSRTIDVEIKSHWSAISPSRQGFLWLNTSSEPLQTAPRYSNLCQSVALKIPSNLTERAKYKAELVVDLQKLDSDPHIFPLVDSHSPFVRVTPRVSSSRYSDLASVNTGM